MKNSELRIGNIFELLTNDTKVLLPTGRNVSITELRTNRVQVHMKSELSEKGFTFIRRIETLRPIKLTKDWLLKFGFDKDNFLKENLYVKGNWWVNLDEYQNFGSIDDIDISLRCYEEFYVHDLQNLYFALTGEELTLKKLGL